jgi:lysozyme
MKYILSFNESINNELFYEISTHDFYSETYGSIELSDKKISDIRKIFKFHSSSIDFKANLGSPSGLTDAIYTMIKIKCKCEPKIIGMRNDGPLYTTTEKIRIYIFVTNDEWYYINSPSNSGSKYYKCDQWDGFISCLTKLIGEMPIVESLLTTDDKLYDLDSIYRDIDSLLLLNESLNISDRIISVLNKVKDLPTSVKRKALLYFVTSLLTVASFHTVYNAILSTRDRDAIEVCQKAKEDIFKDPLEMSCSQKGINHIKKEESLKLKGYKLGDGMITIGWGHAEKTAHSKFKVGQVINKQLAQKLFNKDLEDAENGVKRIFSDWKKRGIDRKVTQDQYDALVSMTFNMGIGSLRTSDMIQCLKRGDYKTAGEEISSTNIMDKFPGLELRREKESKMFLSYLG